MSERRKVIRHQLLDEVGVSHGFGVRGVAAPPGALLPEQVHGIAVARVVEGGRLLPSVADAVVSSRPDASIAIVTADCVPILVATRDGRAVAAIHAGWRGLVAGVIGHGIEALREEAGSALAIVAVVGPHIGVCCYEVDTPVLDAARGRFGDALEDFVRPSGPRHAHIDLGGLAGLELQNAGIAARNRGIVPNCCTHCDPLRFHSYRRDGDRSGRLQHHIRAVADSRDRAQARRGARNTRS